jgi:hypothetical protein
MKTKTLIILLVIALLSVGAGTSAATTRPTIITFDSSLAVIALDDAEAGEATTTLTWHTIGLTEEYRLALHTYVLDDWQLVFPDDPTPLQPSGARVVTIRHPLNFGPPTFLLSVIRVGTNKVVDQRIVTIPYDTSAVTDPPAVEGFSTEIEAVSGAALAAGEARVMVVWDVLNRVPSANLVFDQVFADGTTTSVELPRLYLWIPSTGEGPLAPVYRDGEETVVLRLRVVDVVAGTVYAEQTLELPISEPVVGAAQPAGEAGRAQPAQPAPQPQPAAPTGGVEVFTVSPGTVAPGQPVTLAWQVSGARGVRIEAMVPQMTAAQTVVEAQAASGSATVVVPAYAAYSVNYTLRTLDGAAGATAVVQVSCPFTFFFGQGDGCPTGRAAQVGASYRAFEGGHMIWRSDTNEIYVHFSDGTASIFLEQDYAKAPAAELEGAPPLNRQAPDSGFGRVWANAPGVREKLGWALDDEQGYVATAQRVAPTRIPRPQFAFYITLPGGEVVGSGYGAWRIVAGG